MTDSTPTELLDQRYGRGRARGSRAFGLVAAVVLGAGLVAWLVWAGWHSGHPGVRAELVGYVVVDARRVDVRLDVTTSSGRRAVCEVRASGASGDVVGRTTVSVPADGRRTHRVSASIPTASQAVNGELHACRVS